MGIPEARERIKISFFVAVSSVISSLFWPFSA